MDVYECLGNSVDQVFLGPTFTLDADTKAEPPVVAGAFKGKLKKLIGVLESADSSFVRCIKCSNPLQRGVFKPAEVLNQLKYTGMLDTLLIRRAGFAMRYTYQDF